MQSQWLLVELTIPQEFRDSYVELLWELETSGIEELQQQGDLLLKAYFPAEGGERSESSIEQAVHARGLSPIGISSAIVEHDTSQTLQKWKESFSSFAISPRIYVHPPWEPPSNHHAVNLKLEPGHAFGSGTHESTQLSLLALEQAAPRSRRMLDIGTGSAILTIAANKLAPDLELLLALDIDPLCVEAARENISSNGQHDILLLVGSTAAVAAHFDLVVANLTLAIFQREARDILRVASQRLIVSGFTEEQGPLVLESFRNWSAISISRQWSANGWLCYLLVID